MAVMGSTNHEVEGFKKAVEFWSAQGRSHCSADFMRAAARGFERSAANMNGAEVKAFVETTYTLSKTRRHVVGE